jgi:hypothetical protein
MNHRINFRGLFIILCVLFVCPAIPAQRTSQRINGTVVGINGRSSGRSAQFSLIINGYASAGQVTELNTARQQGEDELFKVLSRMDQGRISVGNSVGVPANVVIAEPWEGGTKITVLYQRNLNFYELRYGRRSADYRFGYAEIFLDQNGKGQGTLIPAARVNLQGNQWVVEDFGVFPARLMGLRSSGRILPS